MGCRLRSPRRTSYVTLKPPRTPAPPTSPRWKAGTPPPRGTVLRLRLVRTPWGAWPPGPHAAAPADSVCFPSIRSLFRSLFRCQECANAFPLRATRDTVRCSLAAPSLHTSPPPLCIPLHGVPPAEVPENPAGSARARRGWWGPNPGMCCERFCGGTLGVNADDGPGAKNEQRPLAAGPCARSYRRGQEQPTLPRQSFLSKISPRRCCNRFTAGRLRIPACIPQGGV